MLVLLVVVCVCRRDGVELVDVGDAKDCLLVLGVGGAERDGPATVDRSTAEEGSDCGCAIDEGGRALKDGLLTLDAESDFLDGSTGGEGLAGAEMD